MNELNIDKITLDQWLNYLNISPITSQFAKAKFHEIPSKKR